MRYFFSKFNICFCSVWTRLTASYVKNVFLIMTKQLLCIYYCNVLLQKIKLKELCSCYSSYQMQVLRDSFLYSWKKLFLTTLLSPTSQKPSKPNTGQKIRFKKERCRNKLMSKIFKETDTSNNWSYFSLTLHFLNRLQKRNEWW